MAALAVVLSYELRLARTADTAAIQAELEPRLGSRSSYGSHLGESFRYAIGATAEESEDEIAVELYFVTKTEKTSLWPASTAVRPLTQDLLDIAAHEIRVWNINAEGLGLRALCEALESSEPRTTVLVPLLDSDEQVLLSLDLALTTAPRACRGAETSAWAGRMRVVEARISTSGGSPKWCSVKGWLTSYM